MILMLINKKRPSLSIHAFHHKTMNILTFMSYDNKNNNNDRIERHTSRFLQSPHCATSCLQLISTFKWPGRKRAQVTCNTSSVYHVQHAVCHVVQRDSSAIKFDRAEIAIFSALSYWLKPLTDEGQWMSATEKYATCTIPEVGMWPPVWWLHITYAIMLPLQDPQISSYIWIRKRRKHLGCQPLATNQQDNHMSLKFLDKVNEYLIHEHRLLWKEKCL